MHSKKWRTEYAHYRALGLDFGSDFFNKTDVDALFCSFEKTPVLIVYEEKFNWNGFYEGEEPLRAQNNLLKLADLAEISAILIKTSRKGADGQSFCKDKEKGKDWSSFYKAVKESKNLFEFKTILGEATADFYDESFVVDIVLNEKAKEVIREKGSKLDKDIFLNYSNFTAYIGGKVKVKNADARLKEIFQ